ncbi:MAG: beta-glucosidase [Clostridiales bacterium]|nr:beta-glucosidase [Clostridiales bacterium]
MNDMIFNLDRYAEKAREAAAEGIVMLKNDNSLLPLAQGTKVAVFGRTQFHYYKSGTGSGGMVNTRYVTGILDALIKENCFIVNEKVKAVYQDWLEEHPFEIGDGWAKEPWFQEEMPLNSQLVEEAEKESEAAIIIIGRTAGEDQDNKTEAGSYFLTETEYDMLDKVCQVFERTIVLLNVGNIIDMKWVQELNPSSVLYVWQGGQEGGSGVIDVISGKVTPSGKLTDTIALDIMDYPSTVNYGDDKRNLYEEDIYVGYRYFETFAQEKVLYPFGFGMSYTSFKRELDKMEETEEVITFRVKVTNTGEHKGKEVVQIYCQAPQGKLGKPVRILCGFAKTKCLDPRESVQVSVTCPRYLLASYDDSGVTGHRFCYVMEKGTYSFYIGGDVRQASYVASIVCEDLIIMDTLKEAMAPAISYRRMKPVAGENGRFRISYEEVPRSTVDAMQRRLENLPQEIAYTGDKGWKLADVSDGKVSMEEFIAQLSNEDLCCIVRGEGMCSPKVTPGTAGAFGGVTKRLADFGIPLGCCADGPSGIRMDSGNYAFAMPNGTCLACSFNEELLRELYEFEGMELRKNKIDTLLGPGMNLHRNPLNGRNFEYFSEDPLVTGKMAVAQLKGMHKYGVTGTIKHFACNNQEHNRSVAEAVVSERALREIYLKGFEIAVKEGEAYCIMSTYGPINGFWTASNYDLLTTILRNEWGFKGFVMTDWWAKGNDPGEPADVKNTSAMVRCQNDLFMVTTNAQENTQEDNSMEGITSGKTTRAEFQRSAVNICNVLMCMPAFLRSRGIETELDKQLKECIAEDEKEQLDMKIVEIEKETEIPAEWIDTKKGKSTLLQIVLKEENASRLSFSCRVPAEGELSQIPLSIFRDKQLLKTITLTGKDTDWRTEVIDLEPAFCGTYFLKFYFGQGGMEIRECKIEQIR